MYSACTIVGAMNYIVVPGYASTPQNEYAHRYVRPPPPENDSDSDSYDSDTEAADTLNNRAHLVIYYFDSLPDIPCPVRLIMVYTYG